MAFEDCGPVGPVFLRRFGGVEFPGYPVLKPAANSRPSTKSLYFTTACNYGPAICLKGSQLSCESPTAQKQRQSIVGAGCESSRLDDGKGP